MVQLLPTSVPILAAVALVATGVVWAGTSSLETAAERLSTHYGLPEIIRGAVILAVGSSFPELSSAVLSTVIHDSFDLGVGAIAGSAIFNILVVPALAAVAVDRLEANRDLVYKEAQFYMISVAALLLTFSLAVIYNPADGVLTGTVTRTLAALPLGLYLLYVFIQFQDARDHTPVDPPGDVAVAREWGRLLLALAVILVAVEGLVQAALGFGEAFGTPAFLWGLTVIAAGTSLPDALVSIRAARRGEPTASLANVLGSNVFDLLVAVPVGVLIAGSAVVDFRAAVPMMGFLTVATVLLFTFIRTDLSLGVREAVVMLVAYAGFVVWMVLETVGVLGLVPGA